MITAIINAVSALLDSMPAFLSFAYLPAADRIGGQFA